jgi:hypothetical protein
MSNTTLLPFQANSMTPTRERQTSQTLGTAKEMELAIATLMYSWVGRGALGARPGSPGEYRVRLPDARMHID